jgi:ubiquinone/menaquinone biosynthesis C-methylase UbiE
LKGGRTLEVSIGTGNNLSYLYEYPGVGEIIGMDISGGQLARCSKYISKHGWPVDLFLSMAEALPFKDESFDSVLHIGGINFFSDRKQAIDEMIRVSKPGTKIVIADETERLKKLVDRASDRGDGTEKLSIIHLVPDTMEQIRMDGIWKAHGKHHGYCLEFRKPA